MPNLLARPAFTTVVTALTFSLTSVSTFPAWGQSPSEPPSDPEAALFLQQCIQCHQGVFASKELVGTHTRPVESLEAAVRRMQEHTGPLTEEQIKSHVDLMKDEEFVFRLEEAQIEAEDRAAEVIKAAEARGEMIDKWALNFMQKCITCHTMGGGRSSGGDLIHTINTSTDTLRQQVSNMQVQVGPMTPEQIDGLTALLKDENRMKRLEGAGLKSPAAMAAELAVATPYVPAPTPSALVATPEPRRVRQEPLKIAPPKGEVKHTPQRMPMGLLIGMTVFTALVGAVGYLVFVKGEK